MSKALKCDRCGICFDPLEVRDEESFSSIREIYTQNGKDFYDVKFRKKMDGVNLCTSCTAEFFKFMSGEGVFENDEVGKDCVVNPAYICLDDQSPRRNFCRGTFYLNCPNKAPKR